ncbi:MAG: hypothetical protein Q7U74_07440, partial [Saprospiraceae bacterium]|nr:hypothetical protein [Saprospiraceae bacterium]
FSAIPGRASVFFRAWVGETGKTAVLRSKMPCFDVVAGEKPTKKSGEFIPYGNASQAGPMFGR